MFFHTLNLASAWEIGKIPLGSIALNDNLLFFENEWKRILRNKSHFNFNFINNTADSSLVIVFQ